jgi:hypothetical protein
MVKRLFAFLILVLLVFPVYSENTVSVKLNLNSIITRLEDNDWSLSGLGSARLSIQSEKNRNVKAQLALETYISDQFMLDIYRAFIKVRFPVFRITFGKSALSWGEGFYYNAGDVIFGESAVTGDMMESELRDNAAWLLSFYFPLGTYSFLEAVVLEPELNLYEMITDEDAEPPHISDTSYGLRTNFKIVNVELETGYLFNGLEYTHSPYMSMQGHLLVDWYLAGSVVIPADAEDIEELEPKLSFGIFHLISFENDATLTLRLETLVKPDALWQETEADDDTEYGLMFFPEVVYNPIDSVGVFFRNIVSPIDLSALFAVGVDWNVYSGLSIINSISVQAGEEADIYGFNRDGGFALTSGLKYIY